MVDTLALIRAGNHRAAPISAPTVNNEHDNRLAVSQSINQLTIA